MKHPQTTIETLFFIEGPVDEVEQHNAENNSEFGVITIHFPVVQVDQTLTCNCMFEVSEIVGHLVSQLVMHINELYLQLLQLCHFTCNYFNSAIDIYW